MFLRIACALALAAAPAVALAEYPEKPVNFIIPFPPGDLEDVLTRMIAEDFQEEYGVAAAVINRPSDSGPFPGAVQMTTAAADGYMIGSFVVDIPVVGPQLGIPALDPSPFEPLGIFLTYPFVIATSADALDCNALASGDFDVINTTIQQILACLDSVKILASVTEAPIAIAPDAPTLGSIAPELDISLWNGLFVLKDTPADVREKIIAVARKTWNLKGRCDGFRYLSFISSSLKASVGVRHPRLFVSGVEFYDGRAI
ncbi:hypothetical protein [Pseudosulfitobacter sp. DSM 107133]|uniref:hypothetical protein n=1 Tax=Pseudosulfitobacter sp. DSM 107133 TaxID=2883100 RepID=UPI001F073855|nr:hypothetical protein [Pseudosulfitobacter sp. DSM 107133]UOA28951.1 hypothetical protein DSM107133_03710 [Pseudosulfitobacter sp. DSM 107133]